MNNKVKVSIIVPVYKVRLCYLDQCLESLLHQTLQDIEIILVDDGAPEECSRACDRYAEIDKRVKVIHGPNEGVSSARNKGIRMAVGEWILFVDSDDWITSNLCSDFVRFADDEDIDIIMGRSINYFSDDNQKISFYGKKENIKIKSNEKDDFIKAIFYDNHKIYSYVDTAGGKLYRLQFLKENSLCFDEEIPIGEDGLFNFEAYLVAKQIMFVNEAYYYYRYNMNSVSNTYQENLILYYEKLFQNYKDTMKEMKTTEYNEAFQYFVLRQVFKYFNRFYFHKQNKMTFFQQCKSIKQLGKEEIYASSLNRKTISKFSKKKKIILYLFKYGGIKIFMVFKKIKSRSY